MQQIYSIANNSKIKSFKTSVLIDKNGCFFAKISDRGELINLEKTTDLTISEMQRGCIGVVLSTSYVTIVPEELFDYSRRQEFLEAAGIYPKQNEVVEVSSAIDGVIAVMAVDKQLSQTLKELNVSKFHSMQMNLVRARDKKLRTGTVLLLNLSSDSLTATLHVDGKLKLAEVFPVANNDEILFIVKNIEQELFPSNGVMKIWGIGATDCYEYLRQFVDKIELDIIDKKETVEYNNLIISTE